MSEFVADNGVRVTDEMVRQWASEAESGFEGLQVEPFEGRAWDEAETEPLEPRTIRVSASPACGGRSNETRPGKA